MRFLLISVLFVLLPACAGTEVERIAAARALAEEKSEEAQALYDQNLMEEAIEIADEAIEEYPHCLEAVLLKSRCLARLLRIDEAFTVLLRQPLGSTEFRCACIEEAAALASRLDQPSIAVHYLKQVLNHYPDRARLWIERGKAEARSGQELAAADSFDRALETGGDPRQVLPPLARVYYQLALYTDAAETLEKLGRQNLTAEEQLLLGAIYCKNKKLDDGLALFRAVASDDANRLDALFNQAQALETMNDLAAAKETYRIVLALDADHAPSLFHLGQLLYREGFENQGLNLIDRAIEEESDPKIKRALESSKKKITTPKPPAEPAEAPGEQSTEVDTETSPQQDDS